MKYFGWASLCEYTSEGKVERRKMGLEVGQKGRSSRSPSAGAQRI